MPWLTEKPILDEDTGDVIAVAGQVVGLKVPKEEGPPSPGLVWVEDWDVLEPAGTPGEDRDWVPGHLCKRLAALDGEAAADKAGYDMRVRQRKARRARLVFLYQDEVEAYARELGLHKEGSKKKSVDVDYGRIGFRKNTKVLIRDEESVVAWCYANGYECAVKTTLSVRKKELPPNTPVIDGLEWPTGNVFYVRPAK